MSTSVEYIYVWVPFFMNLGPSLHQIPLGFDVRYSSRLSTSGISAATGRLFAGLACSHESSSSSWC
jgi:hypothetical protein